MASHVEDGVWTYGLLVEAEHRHRRGNQLRRGDEDDECAGVKWWAKAKVITVYKLTAIKINLIEPELQNPVETFEDVYTAQQKANSEHISPPNKQQRRV